MLFDINAPIVPGMELGGIKIGSHISLVEGTLSMLLDVGKITATVLTGSRVRYDLGVMAIEFDINNGQVIALKAYQGYKGCLFSAATIGSPIKTLFAKGHKLLYDDFEEEYFIKDVKGLSFKVLDKDTEPDGEAAPLIASINVYDTKLDHDSLLATFDEVEIL